MIKPQKGLIHKSTYNPQARAAQNYNVVEDLAQSPSSMSTLEVLQIFPPRSRLYCRPLVELIQLILILSSLIIRAMCRSY